MGEQFQGIPGAVGRVHAGEHSSEAEGGVVDESHDPARVASQLDRLDRDLASVRGPATVKQMTRTAKTIRLRSGMRKVSAVAAT